MGIGWRRAAVVALAFVVAIAVTVVFAYRAGRQARNIRWENEPIRAWMSVPFIAHTHHLPPYVLFQAMGVHAREPRDRRSVRQIARDLNRPVPELMDDLQRAISGGGHPPGTPLPGPRSR